MPRFRSSKTGVVVNVPDSAVDNLSADFRPVGEVERSSDPDSSWRVGDLREYAVENGIELAEGAKKADILEAIEAFESANSEQQD